MRADAHTLAVEHARLGQHAFAYYEDDEARWEVAAAFIGRGCALGHKVIVVPDPAVSRQEAWERITAWSGVTEQALAGGQVACATMREIIYPDPRFSAARQLIRLREATAEARREGYAGLRLFIDMRWVHDLGLDIDQMMAWEASADELFTAADFAAVCSYDRRAFAPEVVEAMRAGHPVALLGRPGELRAYRSDHGCHLIGDADIATAPSFRAALSAALDAAAAGRVLLDLSRLCFLSVGCAADLLRLGAASGCRPVVVRCSATQARTLRQLGAGSMPWLVVES
jgi:anti-anti-sigma regulatory factor